ncbi:MAG: SDR family oxidoreductase [Flavobacteriales bacterium]|nr:SDR family oxidoreductase [Flavobacteriales bacterium]MCB9190250.1 SDR family oxidoreductase [Flavobacteriales bacterium]
MRIDLKGKRALVCGSTAGIGKAVALQLAEAGATVTLLARNEEKLKAVCHELDSSSGQKHGYLVADFSKPEALKIVVDNHMKSANPYHILLNNTGGPPGGLAVDAELDEFERAFRSHLMCNHVLVQALVSGMKAEGYGRIINIISTSVKIPLNGLGVSNTIRGAVANWSKTLANELGQFGITVNNVLPGATETERLSSIISNKASKTGKSEHEVANAMRAQVPAARFAQPWEVAAAATFLASPLAGYINGINVPVDGGRTGSL